MTDERYKAIMAELGQPCAVTLTTGLELAARLRALRGPWIGDGIQPAINAYHLADVLQSLAEYGPAMKRGECANGTPWMGTMLDVLQDYKLAASVEAGLRREVEAERDAAKAACRLALNAFERGDCIDRVERGD